MQIDNTPRLKVQTVKKTPRLVDNLFLNTVMVNTVYRDNLIILNYFLDNFVSHFYKLSKCKGFCEGHGHKRVQGKPEEKSNRIMKECWNELSYPVKNCSYTTWKICVQSTTFKFLSPVKAVPLILRRGFTIKVQV